MVKNKRIGMSCLSLLAGLFLAFPASSAGLPTLDIGVLGNSIAQVKNGIENIKGIKTITEQAGKLNSIVGDAVGTVSKMKDDIAGEVEKGMQKVEKAKKRLEKAKTDLADFQADVKEQKDKYQALKDQVEQKVSSAQKVAADVRSEINAARNEVENVQNEIQKAQTKVAKVQSDIGEYRDEYQEARDAVAGMVGGVTSNGMNYSDGANEEVFVDGIPDIDNRFVDGVPSAQIATTPEETEAKATLDAVAVEGATVDAVQAPVMMQKTPVTAPVRGFRTSPVEKAPVTKSIEGISSNMYRSSEQIAFAEQFLDGKMVAPGADICELGAEEYATDPNVQTECNERIIKDMAHENQFDSKLAVDACQRMVYQTVLAVLGEATATKAEAAGYQETLDEQEDAIAQCADITCLLEATADTNAKMQYLLNSMMEMMSGQVMVDSVEKMCGFSAKVLNLEEDGAAEDNNGEE